MPWKETCAVEERMKFVMDYISGDYSKAALCRSYGISRPTADKWLSRYAQAGVAGLHIYTMDRSHAAVGIVNRLRDEGLL